MFSVMHHPRRAFLGALAAAGGSAALNLPARASLPPGLPAGLARAIAAYGQVIAWTRTASGHEADVRIRARPLLAAGLGGLHRFGTVRAGGNEVRLESAAGLIVLRHSE